MNRPTSEDRVFSTVVTVIVFVSWISVILVALGVKPAVGQALPDFDAKGYCSAMQEQAETVSAIQLVGCIEQEQAAYDDLVAIWPQVPEPVRHRCVTLEERAAIGRPGTGSFFILLACIEAELDALRMLNEQGA